jgi:ribose 5-phosphate isomerase B
LLVCADRAVSRHRLAGHPSGEQNTEFGGLALDIVDSFLTTHSEGGRHATRVAMIEELPG